MHAVFNFLGSLLGRMPVTADVVTELFLVHAGNALKSGKRDCLCVILKERSHVVLVLKFNLLEFFPGFSVILFHILVPVLKDLEGFFHGLACARNKIRHIIRIHVDAVVSV